MLVQEEPSNGPSQPAAAAEQNAGDGDGTNPFDDYPQDESGEVRPLGDLPAATANITHVVEQPPQQQQLSAHQQLPLAPVEMVSPPPPAAAYPTLPHG